MANWSENALKLLERRYLARDEQGEIKESPGDMLDRVVKNIVSAQGMDDWADDYFEIMDSLDFLPNSPTLMNAGRPLQQLSACFAWKVPDSLEGIFSSIEKMAVVQKSGGGTGFWFGDIREEGSIIQSTMHMKASGPVDYMPLFDHATEVVQQGGMRRGASIAVLPIWHPDIESFIKMKSEEGVLANFNISVAITDKFMEALSSDSSYPLRSPLTGKITIKRRARTLWNLICDSIWANGEPGVLYWNRIQKDGDGIGMPIIGVNPCGELPLPDYGSCNLGSINLAHYDDNIEWLRNRTKVAVRFLNGVIDANKLPLSEIDETSKKYRQIGLGIMGWADLLLHRGIKYGSSESFNLAEFIMREIRHAAYTESVELLNKYEQCPATDGQRVNTTLLAIAPTGSISILAGCSSGIEPIWDTKYASYVLPDKNYEEASERGELTKIERDYEDISDAEHFVTAMQVPPREHVAMQAAFQNHVDGAVSKTVNMSENMTIDDVKQALVDGYKSGCKGLTIYRDKSRKVQVIRSTVKSNISEDIKDNAFSECDEEKIAKDDAPSEGKRPMKRPDVLDGKTHKVQTGCGSLYAVINKTEDGRIREVFLRGGKSGGCSSTFLETAGRLITLALRADVPAASVIKQIKYCRCSMPSLQSKSFSCMDAIGKLLEVELGQTVEQENGDESCPNCDDKLRPVSGCWECPSCGYSRCN